MAVPFGIQTESLIIDFIEVGAPNFTDVRLGTVGGNRAQFFRVAKSSF